MKKTQFQSFINTPNVISSCPKASTSPYLSISTDETTRPPATDAARRPPATSRVRGRGRPLGKGQASREVISRRYGVYINPITNKLFEVYGDSSRIISSSKK